MPRDLDVVILGSSDSEGSPNVDCMTRRDGTGCAACRAYQEGDLRNARYGSSAVVCYFDESSQRRRTILVDCGPDIKSQVCRFFKRNGLREIDAVLLTHAHDDATDGIGSLRSWTSLGMIQSTVHIYCTRAVEAELRTSKPWLYDAGHATGSRVIGHVTFHTIKPNESFELYGMPILPLLVEHGKGKSDEPYPCLAFLFDKTLLYASDQNHIPDSSMALLRSNLGTELPLLLVASLRLQPHPSHFSFAQACWLARVLNAQQTYLICLADGPSHRHWMALCDMISQSRPRDTTLTLPLAWRDYPAPEGVPKERLLWFSEHTEAGFRKRTLQASSTTL